jgi:hypothetical protein
MKSPTISSGETAPARPITQSSANASIDSATLELLATWRITDASDHPEDIRTAEQELADFKKAINDNRTASGEPLLYP